MTQTSPVGLLKVIAKAKPKDTQRYPRASNEQDIQKDANGRKALKAFEMGSLEKQTGIRQ
jgi:hypothetical protein